MPSFETYLSILSDSWMPWLEENRKSDKFESIIRGAGPSFQASHPEFFSAIIQVFKRLRIGLSEKLLSEFEHLSLSVESPFGKKLGHSFVKQPFLNLREYFYNVFTGQSLAAYHDLTEQFFKQHKGTETKAFYVEKILSDLHAQMHIPLPLKFEYHEDESIVLKVKLAIALQFQLIMKKYVAPGSVLTYFDTRGWLENTVQQSQNSTQLLSVFDSFAGNGQPADQEQVPARSETETGIRKDEPGLTHDKSIIQMVTNLQQDYNELKHGIISIVQNEQIKKAELPTEKWLAGKEVCKILRISKSTLNRYRHSGKIKFSRLGNKMRYKENDILQILKENENTDSKQ